MNILDQALSNLAILPIHYERDQKWQLKAPYSSAANRYTIQSPNRLSVNINNVGYALSTQAEIDLSASASWDTTTPTDYTTAANRAGKDFYIYACQPASGVNPILIVSANSTAPSGYTTSNSRKIGGFHCLCLAVGTIASRDLTDFATGDVLPLSIWDLKHKPREASPEGMVYSSAVNKWVDIYLASGTGTSTASVYGGTISDSRIWLDFVDDGYAVKKRLLRDAEFQAIAAGSNEQTNITGSADPVTTGGHVNTASRRMVSNIGCEDCCGVEWQWLDEQSYQLNAEASISSASKTLTAYHAASPGGNPIYVKYDETGVPYLCCNLATIAADVWLTLGTDYRVLLKHDANAATGGVQLYFDEDASQPSRLLAALGRGKTAYIPTNHPAYWMAVTYNAAPATPGVAINYDDGGDNRLEFTSPTSANGAIDLALNAVAGWSYKTIGGSKGQLYSQGAYGDVKLLAGGNWYYSSRCGSRARSADSYRWYSGSSIGGRFAAEPL